MVTPEFLLAVIEKARAESAAGAVKNPNLDVSLEFGFGVAHGRDQAFEIVLGIIADHISEAEDDEQEDE